MYLDADGNPQARFIEPPRNRGLIGLFLQMDVGRNSAFTQTLLATTQEILRDQRTTFEGTGNLFTVIITRDRVRIENAYADDDDESVELTPEEFVEILQTWKALITRT